MKKLSILLIGLLLVTGFAFGQEVSLTGSATMTFGVDLDSGATGISNAISLNTIVTFWDETAATEGSGVWGFIELAGFRFRVYDGATDDAYRDSRVTAKLMIDPIYIQIWGDSGVSTSYDESVDSANLNSRVGYSPLGLTDAVSNAYSSEFMGIAIGTSMDALDAALYVQSEYDWDATDGANTNNAYALGVYASVKAVEGLTLKVEADFGVNYAANPIGAGVQGGYDVALGDMTLTPNFGFDYVDGAIEIDGGVYVGWAGTSGWSYHPLTGWAYNYSGFGVSVIYNTDLGVNISTFEDSTEGLVPTVGWAIVAELVGLTTTADVGVAAYINADLDPIVPWVKVEALNALTALSLMAEVGADISAIDNTTFTLKWTSGDLQAATPVLGTVSFATKISL